ncbi:MAG: Asp-tRNA(Asn)/Glu-tRNA(Gln) amidotransferase subunit GatC [Thermodesulfovibrionales bacterium]
MGNGVKIEIGHVALLARLALTGEEEKRFGDQLNTILDYIGKLNELDTSEIPPTSHVLEIQNVMREDIASPSLSKEKALSNAPDKTEDFYRVPKIID